MRHLRYIAILAMLAVPGFPGLFAGAEEPKPAPAPRPPAPPPLPRHVGGVHDAKDGATLKGIVRFRGRKAERKPIDGYADNAYCRQAADGHVPLKESFIFGKNGDDDTLVNVIVHITKGLDGKRFDPPKAPVVMEEVRCMYVPHVVGLMTGQKLMLVNRDDTLHNLQSPAGHEVFGQAMPVKGEEQIKVYKKPEMPPINFKCQVHPWMNAYVAVFDHPCFAVTGEDGTFELRGLPAGTFEVSVWHEFKRFAPDRERLHVEVKAGETKAVEFVYGVRPSEPRP